MDMLVKVLRKSVEYNLPWVSLVTIGFLVLQQDWRAWWTMDNWRPICRVLVDILSGVYLFHREGCIYIIHLLPRCRHQCHLSASPLLIFHPVNPAIVHRMNLLHSHRTFHLCNHRHYHLLNLPHNHRCRFVNPLLTPPCYYCYFLESIFFISSTSVPLHPSSHMFFSSFLTTLSCLCSFSTLPSLPPPPPDCRFQ